MQKRPLILAAAATVLVSLASASPAAAQDRYCLQGRIWGYPGNCKFATYGQCMASASGTDAYCDLNPRAAFARDVEQPDGYAVQSPRHRRRHH